MVVELLMVQFLGLLQRALLRTGLHSFLVACRWPCSFPFRRSEIAAGQAWPALLRLELDVLGSVVSNVVGPSASEDWGLDHDSC